MKTNILSCLLVASALASASSNAATVFTDTFDSGTGDWHKAYSNTNTTLNNDSGLLSFSSGQGGGFEVIGRSFTAQPIPVGYTINLSFDYRQTSPTGILRVGLYDLSGGAFSADNWANTSTGTYAGYTTFIRDNGTNIARREVASFTTATSNGFPTYGVTGITDITMSGGGTNFTFQNNTDYQFTFSITRTSETQTDTLLTVMEGEDTRYAVAGSQTSGTHLNVFNTAVLRTVSGTALFDNIQVSVIPEPSTALLGGLGLLALLRRRR